MANLKDVFVSNVGATEANWHTNRVGPWRLSYSYHNEDGDKVRVETRWKGISNNSGRYDWRSGSEQREVVVKGPMEG